MGKDSMKIVVDTTTRAIVISNRKRNTLLKDLFQEGDPDMDKVGQIVFDYNILAPQTKLGMRLQLLMAAHHICVAIGATPGTSPGFPVYNGKCERELSLEELVEMNGSTITVDLDAIAVDYFEYHDRERKGVVRVTIPEEYKIAARQAKASLVKQGRNEDASIITAAYVRDACGDENARGHVALSKLVKAAQKQLEKQVDFDL